jgi:hypothetical protein
MRKTELIAIVVVRLMLTIWYITDWGGGGGKIIEVIPQHCRDSTCYMLYEAM